MADGERSVRIEQQRDVRVAITRDPARPSRAAVEQPPHGGTAERNAEGRQHGEPA